MKEDWESIIAFVLKMEGGADGENDPSDPGGYTKFGISSKAYPSLDIKNLTLSEAKEIYHKDYWLACSCDDLPSALSMCVMDTAVNQGTTKAKRILQIALGMDLVDGIIGPKTIAAAAKSGRGQVKKYLAERLTAYARLMAENQNLLKFSLNWNYRVLSLAEIVLKS